MEITTPQLNELLQKVEAMKKSGTVDLSTEEDLALAIMNLVSLEEHLFFTAEKTGKDEYFDLLGEIRENRKALLARMISRHEGETWCISKHLLAASMRLIEVGTKLHADGRKEEAKEIFGRAHQLYTLFWGLRLKLISTQGLKTVASKDQPWMLSDIVNKLVDCCDE